MHRAGTDAGPATLGAIVAEGLRRRFRSRQRRVLLGVYAAALLGTALLAYAVFSALAALAPGTNPAGGVSSAVVLMALLLALVFAPALSARALIPPAGAAASAPAGVFGTVLAEMLAALAFPVVALPFLVVGAAMGGIPAVVALASWGLLAVEIALMTAIVAGLGGVIARPRLAVGAGYLLLGLLTIGSVVVFAVVGLSSPHDVVTHSRSMSATSTDALADCDQAYREGATDCEDDGSAVLTTCGPWQEITTTQPRMGLAWWVLVPNPFVVVADGAARAGYSSFLTTVGRGDLLALTSLGLWNAQAYDQGDVVMDSCPIDGRDAASTDRLFARAVPTWGIGLLVQAALAAGLLAGAVARARRTP